MLPMVWHSAHDHCRGIRRLRYGIMSENHILALGSLRSSQYASKGMVLVSSGGMLRLLKLQMRVPHPQPKRLSGGDLVFEVRRLLFF